MAIHVRNDSYLATHQPTYPGMQEGPNPQILIDLVKTEMPFGKYKGRLVYQLPVSYLEWFKREGFPKGKLGALLETMYEIKLNGLDALLDPLKNRS